MIYVEVNGCTEKIERKLSKENLNTVLQTTTRKQNFGLFDKFAYLTRAARLNATQYDGLLVDSQGLVQFQQTEKE